MSDPFDHLAIPDFLKADPNTPRATMSEDHPIRLAAEKQRAERDAEREADRRIDPATQAFLDQQAAERKIKARNRIAKMLAKKAGPKAEKWISRCTGIQGNEIMKSIECGARTYTKPSDAARAAARFLGLDREAVEGKDFELEPKEGRWALTLKSARPEGKRHPGATDKIAKGPTEIERSYSASSHTIKIGEVDPKMPAKIKEAKRKAAAEALAKTGKVTITHGDGSKTKIAIGKPAKHKPAIVGMDIGKGGKVTIAPKAKAAKPMKAGPDDAEKAASAALRKAPAAKKAKAGESKVAAISALLTRPEGTTTAEVLKATGWPSVSMPQQAKAAGVTLRKEKKPGEPTRYYAA